MASPVMVSSTASAATASRLVVPFNGLKIAPTAFPATKRANAALSRLPSNGGRVQCMQVWPIEGKKKFETFSYLPPLKPDELLKQIDYLLRNGWVPCLEFCKIGFVYREHHHSPGYYDGRLWTMWKLPMFGCTDPSQVAKEVLECKKSYPDAFVRIIGFDNVRQVQCVSFVAAKPDGYVT